MEINIRKNIINNLKNESTDKILSIIDEGCKNDDELALPGLGVILEVCWNKLSIEEKENFVKILKKEMN